mgnify:CR=1 FL=1
MSASVRSTNLRFNLEKEPQRRAWEYLQTMDRTRFKSYSQTVALALVEYFDRYYRSQDGPYLETREREERLWPRSSPRWKRPWKRLCRCSLPGALRECPQAPPPQWRRRPRLRIIRTRMWTGASSAVELQ